MTNLQRFQKYTSQLDSPDIYILWAFYSMISISLGRRVWLQNYDDAIFPNLYIALVGPPAVGKSEASVKAKRLLESAKCGKSINEGTATNTPVTNWAPTNVTVEHLITIMAERTRVEKMTINSVTRDLAFTEWTVFLDGEMGSFFRKNTEDLQRFLTEMYSKSNYMRGTQAYKEQSINNLSLNFIGCATPHWMKTCFSDSMLADGFASRMILVYAESPRSYTGFREIRPASIEHERELIKHIEKIARLRGEIKRTPEVIDYVNDWMINVFPDVNKRMNRDPVLDSYYARKKLHLLKLSIAMCFAEGDEMLLKVEHIQAAEKLLAQTESSMHLALSNAGKHPFNILVENARKLLNDASGELTRKRLEALLINTATKEELGAYSDPPKLVKSCIEFMKNVGELEEVQVNKKILLRTKEMEGDSL